MRKKPSSVGSRIASRLKPLGLPVAAIAAANLVPLLGVLFLGWSLGDVLLLYWVESAVIGFFNVQRMLHAGGVVGLPLVLFFLVHYGGFMAGHMVFLQVLFLGGDADDLPRMLVPLLLPILGLVAGHGVAFWRDFLRNPVAWERSVGEWMFAPYPRIMAMHVTLLAGAFLAQFLGTPAPALALLVVLKTLIDVGLYQAVPTRRDTS